VIASLAAGIVLGFVLGGIAPRVALEDREARIATLEEELEAADTGGWRSPVPGLDRILRAPRREGALPGAEGSSREEGREPGEGAIDEGIEEVGDGGVPPPRWRDRWRERTEDASPEDRLSTFRRAVSIQRARRMQSREALRQQGDLSDEEIDEVDAALQEMNEEIYGHGEELVVLAMGDEPPAARDLLGITHDVTGILHRAQLRLETILGPERAANVDPSALEIWNHVDLAQLEPAARSAIERSP
jgi:hypothetical protein